MTFQLDTTGEVDLSIAEGVPAAIAGGYRWFDLSPFTQGYIEALLREIGAAFWQLAPETLARIIADCDYYEKQTGGAPSSEPYWGMTLEMGAAFWQARQVERWLDLRPLTVQLCDDGKVRFA
jgi:hypothetical protein